MLRVPIRRVEPGMVVALPVLHPDVPNTTLLRRGFVIDDVMARRLRSLPLNEIWIEFPGLEFIGQYISPEIMAERGRIATVVATMLDSISQHGFGKLDYPSYVGAIRGLVAKLRDDPRAALLIQTMAEGDRPLMRHSSDVCYLCLLLGLKLESYLISQRRRLMPHRARDVTNLGVAAMLHDTGMMMLPPEVVERWRCTQDESDRQWREHVRLGYLGLRDGLEPSAASAILNHHQRFDGSGFPSREGKLAGPGLQGQSIHIFARILSAAETFDRLQHPPSGEPDRPIVMVLNTLRQPEWRRRIDPIVFKAMLAVVPAYPPGAHVTLSDGRDAVVTAFTPTNPCCPKVRIIRDQQPASVKAGPEVDLQQRSNLSIASVDGVDVRESNFYPAAPDEFQLHADEAIYAYHDETNEIDPESAEVRAA